MLKQEHGDRKIKPSEQLVAGGFSFQWFLCVQLRERLNVDNRTFGTEQQKTEFEIEMHR